MCQNDYLWSKGLNTILSLNQFHSSNIYFRLSQHPDGSEYAGHEFDLVNFSSNYKSEQTQHQHRRLGKRSEGRNMAEGVGNISILCST